MSGGWSAAQPTIGMNKGNRLLQHPLAFSVRLSSRRSPGDLSLGVGLLSMAVQVGRAAGFPDVQQVEEMLKGLGSQPRVQKQTQGGFLGKIKKMDQQIMNFGQNAGLPPFLKGGRGGF